MKPEYGNGQRTRVRIEHCDGFGSAMRRADFEDSDDELGDGVADVGWCLYYAIEMLEGGDDGAMMTILARAMGMCEPSREIEGDDEWATESRLLIEVFDAACKWRDFRDEHKTKRKMKLL